MRFKPSAGIFVGGLLALFTAAVLLVFSIAGDGRGALAMAMGGLLLSLVGIIMLCVGAARALTIIDAIPAAFRSLNNGQAPNEQAPAPQSSSFQQQGYNQPPVQ